MVSERKDIDEIIEKVMREIPAAHFHQLKVTHPTDDDGIWYFYLPDLEPDIQIESSFGMCPFLVETNEQSGYDARRANTVDEAASMVVDYLNSITQGNTN